MSIHEINTDMGSSHRGFEPTQWSLVIDARTLDHSRQTEVVNRRASDHFGPMSGAGGISGSVFPGGGLAAVLCALVSQYLFVGSQFQSQNGGRDA